MQGLSSVSAPEIRGGKKKEQVEIGWDQIHLRKGTNGNGM